MTAVVEQAVEQHQAGIVIRHALREQQRLDALCFVGGEQTVDVLLHHLLGKFTAARLAVEVVEHEAQLPVGERRFRLGARLCRIHA